MIRKLSLLCVLAAAPAAAQAREPYPGLDAYIANAVKQWKMPGMSVAIVRNDTVIYAKGFGTLSSRNSTPVTERTLFEIGSSSKAFTATLVAMLVGEGKMRWDERLAAYLPDFRMSDATANEGVTLRDALSHRSGIARGELAWLGSGATADEVLHRVRFIKPEAPFRSHYSYQNMMFLAAGQAAAKVSGMSWQDLVRQRIFTPLGMTSTVPSSTMASGPVALPHGMDHDTAFIQPAFNAENIAPAGAILSSAVDMAQWLRFQLNDGVVGGKRLVTSAALRETHTPQIIIPSAGGGRGGAADSTPPVTHFQTYGFGWMIEDYRGALVWQHGGNTLGMTAAVGMMPEKKVGVVVLSNMQSAQLPAIIMRYVFDRALGAPMKDLSGEAYARYTTQRQRADSVERAQAASHPSNAQPPIPLQKFVGTYADSLYGEAVVSVANGRLEMRRADWAGPLQYWNATNFRWNLPPGMPTGPLFIKFEITPDDSVTGLYFGIGSDVNLMSRKAPPRGRGGGRGGAR
jgi:CubicO group peptidase (beta-lactamase class C family)